MEQATKASRYDETPGHFQAAKDALNKVLSTPAHTIAGTVRDITATGNRAIFALQVLNNETAFDKQTITVTTEAPTKHDQ